MPSVQKRFSLRARLLAVVTLILVAGFLATNVISYQVSRKTLRQTLIENELPLTSNNVYSEIQADLLQPIFVASLMAHDTFVKDWLLEGERDVERITRYLKAIRDRYDVFTSFLISDNTRHYYHFTGLTETISRDDPTDAWFFRTRKMDQPYEINVDFNAAQDDALTIFINHRVLDYQGDFLATTGVGLKFDTVAEIVDDYQEHFGRNIYFVDPDGAIMVRSGGAAVTEDRLQQAEGLAAEAEAILSSDQGFYEYRRDDETYLLTTRYIPELDWRVLVEQSEAEAMRGIRRGLMTNTAIGLAVIAVTILVIAYTVNLFQRRLETMATTDKLTGINNRQVFDMGLDHALKRKGRTPAPFSVILLDVDHFKRVNDELGHLTGDQVIREVARLTGEAIRESDILCRWGGEELIILAEDCAMDDAAAMAEKIRTTIEAATLANLPDGSPLTVSAGVTQYRDDDTADAILGRADDALYRAKQGGRNRVEVE